MSLSRFGVSVLLLSYFYLAGIVFLPVFCLWVGALNSSFEHLNLVCIYKFKQLIIHISHRNFDLT